ncbi:hypothetical protein [Catenuloplanes atrovinosus]|uniref:LysM domain-containing protein n=1 Tax=Catenuloplanes atrovinosus TaxID=137266 RepID=A0AAE3YNV9_9ACTN|nr:hypothetical protein [Catenuloplanes atrovinosus]MDR7277283.1 hypothetical protein [Catenuloplanes atrovinosus]
MARGIVMQRESATKGGKDVRSRISGNDAAASPGWRHRGGRWVAAIALALAATAATGAGAAEAVVAVPATASAAPSGKYYIVGTDADGRPEYLYAIAAATLGDGRRYPEIIALNQGRVQPDGRHLSDPPVLQPGWILHLPADARGEGVRTGTSPSGGTPTGTPAIPPPPAIARPPAADPAAPLIRIVSLCAAGGLVVLAALVVRRGRGHVRGRRPERRRAPRKVIGTAVAVRAVAVVPAAPVITAVPPVTVGAELGEPATEAVELSAPGAPSGPVVVEPSPPSRLSGRARAPLPAPDERPAGWSPPGPPRPCAAAEEPKASRGVPDEPVPASGDAPVPVPAELPAPPTTPAHLADLQRPDAPAAVHLVAPLRASLRSGGDRIQVSLVGARTHATDSRHYAWLAPGQQPPVVDGSVVLGHGDQGRLWVDLTLSPDPLTVTGPAEAALRHLHTLIDQLWAAGSPVAVHGTALRDGLPAGCRYVADLAGLPEVLTGTAGVAAGRFQIVVLAAGDGDMTGPIQRFCRSAGPRVIPIVTGAVPDARWTVRLTDPAG